MRSSTTRRLTHRLRRLVGRRPSDQNDREPRSRPVGVEALETRELLSADSAWNFVTAPQLHPPKVNVLTRQPGTAPGLIFVAPYSMHPAVAVSQSGPMIMDDSGNPVWFVPVQAPTVALDFQAQTLSGRRVLTWWQGTIATGGPSGLPVGTSLSPDSHFIIDNNHYQQMMTVSARNGFTTDLHDFDITPRGIGVLIGTKVENANLTPYGGVQNGSFLDAEVQGINLRTGRLAFAWDIGQHVPLSDSYVPAPTSAGVVWDPYHVNSADVSSDGMQLLVSARHTSTVYDINLRTGQTLWEFGGKQNTIHVTPGLATGPDASLFQDQHNARFVPGGISVFDNGGVIPGPDSGPFSPSRGMVFNINPRTLTATLQAPLFSHASALFSNSQGNVQTLPNGNTFIGWGADTQSDGSPTSYFSEFNSNGAMIYDAQLPGQDVSYQALRLPWVGVPLTPPAIAVTQAGAQHTVYASWNGSTNTEAWRLLAGNTASALRPVALAGRSGFETAITTTAPGPFYRVQALGPGGRVLSMSSVIDAAQS